MRITIEYTEPDNVGKSVVESERDDVNVSQLVAMFKRCASAEGFFCPDIIDHITCDWQPVKIQIKETL